MRSPSCVFCRLLSDQGQVTWLARREHASALLPLKEGRLSPAHTLVVSNDHAVGFHDASAESLYGIVLLAQEVARAMERSIGARGVNILNASGPDSDQSVPHLHLHVVPRWSGDGLSTWPITRSHHTLDGDWLGAVRTAMSAWTPQNRHSSAD